MNIANPARRFILTSLLITVATVLLGSGTLLARDLTFEERVAAQEAIERVYYSHQIGATKPFEEAVPREVLEGKVRTYLKQSAALEQFWHTPVTAEMLRAELERIVRGTHMPDRLRDVSQALGSNSFLIQECLARPILVERLTRSFFSADERIHGSVRTEAEALRVRLVNRELAAWTDEPHRTVLEQPLEALNEGVQVWNPDPLMARKDRTQASSQEGFPGMTIGRGTRIPLGVGEIGPLAEEKEAFFIQAVLQASSTALTVATYVFPKIPWENWWSTRQVVFTEGSVAAVADDVELSSLSVTLSETQRPDCIPGDTWNSGSLDTLPEEREGHTAVWTGNEMLIWGGKDNIALNTGGRYDPVTDVWRPIATEGAPSSRYDHSAIWTGNEMIVWGGSDSATTWHGTGGRYDPTQDRWTSTTLLAAPQPRARHTAVWTGHEMIIWGGFGDKIFLDTGARYDPSADTWATVSASGAPSARERHTAIWTGRLMVIWGGWSGTQNPKTAVYPEIGGRYDPASDTWTPTQEDGIPPSRIGHIAVWTGEAMVVWGGNYRSQSLSSGGRYLPETDAWLPLVFEPNLQARHDHTAVWSGSEIIIWGGSSQDSPYVTAPLLNDGAAYNPVTDHWRILSGVNAPTPRTLHTAVWTGKWMVVWGGRRDPAQDAYGPDWSTGGRYDPDTDSWTPTGPQNQPSKRRNHTAVWTGNLMLVWGGHDIYGQLLGTGSRYDPVLDAWLPISTLASPSARRYHTAIWTGSQMIVWGGQTSIYYANAVNTGGRYDPISDSWQPTTLSQTPTERCAHSGLWTGTEMIVWGGMKNCYYPHTPLSSGGRYDPVADHWSPMATEGAPAPRMEHTAVWTGDQMIIWGGEASHDGGGMNTGGRYDPLADAWTATATLAAPSARSQHIAVWTGTHMVVWGGFEYAGYSSPLLNTGGTYDPMTNGWAPVTTDGAPVARRLHSAVWTGKEVLIWGGEIPSEWPGASTNTGGGYDPITNGWRPLSLQDSPLPSKAHTAVWTGNMMIVWGGSEIRIVPLDSTSYQVVTRGLESGGRYSPEQTGEAVVADAGPDQEIECTSSDGTKVILAGSGSSCMASDPITYTWTGPFPEGGGTVHGATSTVTLPLGLSTLELTVENGLGQYASDSVTIAVKDSIPPMLACPSVPAVECVSEEGTPVTIPSPQVLDTCDANPVVQNSYGAGGADASGLYPLGQTEVTMTAMDASGNQAGCAFPVTVIDTTPPLLFASVSPDLLWPPNHQMVDISASVVASDACGASTVLLSSVLSSEPDDAPWEGDGTTTGDIRDAEIGTADFEFLLRAERDGEGDGRTYEIVYLATDGSGNSANAVSFVLVPHDVGKGFEYQWNWRNRSHGNP